MQFQIQGHHLDIGDALKTHITDRLSAVNEKYFNRGVEATITLSKDGGSTIKTHITMKGGRDILVMADSVAHDPYASFDDAAEKIAKQLRRYKRRLRDHHERLEQTPQAEMAKARDYILANDKLTEAESEESFEGGDEPLIVAEMVTNIQKLSVSEAVMRMELSDQNALMFYNTQHGRINMVYRRKDGNVGWIDPEAAKEVQAAE